MITPQDIILQPIVSEKSYDRMADGIYYFKVRKDANKIQIREAVEELFSVTVKSVRTSVVPSKPKRRGVYVGRTTEWKKACVTLKEGDKIAFFEGIA
ncbi:MAG: 50S ribosomal protein L23 [Candidatus Riflebacteria bacterium]|nr:50S ribosomal protein L23 [Candidatus Riflebacteria bacterium]